MLHAVAQLAQDDFRNVAGALGDEVDAHALRADEADDLLYLVEQGLAGAFEQHVGLVEEEDELGQLQVAHLGQLGIELREQPQQECAVELRLHHQLVGSQHAHHALAAFCLQQVVDVERRLAEEILCPLSLQLQQGALDGSYRLCGNVTILRGVFLGVLRHIVEHGAQVFQVEDEQATVVGYAEGDVQHAVLCLVQLQQAAQQLRPHLADGGSHGVTLLTEDIVEPDRTALELWIL